MSDFNFVTELLEALREPVIVLEHDQVTFVNEAAAHFLGQERNELLLWNKKRLRRSINGGEAGAQRMTQAEKSRTKKAGDSPPRSIKVQEIETGGRKLQCYIVREPHIAQMKRDLREKEKKIKRLQDKNRKLAEETEKYKTMGETIPYGVWATDAEGKAIYISPSWCEMMGRTFEEARDAGWIDFLIPEEREKVKKLWRHSLETQEPFEHEHHFVDKNGEIKTVLSKGLPVRNKKGETISWVGVNLDITDRDQAQKKLSSSHQTLKESHERQQNFTLLLENLLYLAAHDLKGPVANMKLTLSMIDRVKNLDEKFKMLHNFKALTTRIDRTISGIMEILEIEKGSDKRPESIKIEEVIDQLETEYKEKLQEANGAISRNLQQRFVVYFGAFFFSILENLISNAIKYRSEKDLDIRISAKKENEFVCIKVEDNGIGIDIKKNEKILFQPYQRFTNQSDGAGVGLYIVKNIIEKNGGKIRLESQPGKGSTFYCYLKEWDNHLQ